MERVRLDSNVSAWRGSSLKEVLDIYLDSLCIVRYMPSPWALFIGSRVTSTQKTFFAVRYAALHLKGPVILEVAPLPYIGSMLYTGIECDTYREHAPFASVIFIRPR